MVRVTIVGAAGGIGQSLSLLIKLNPNVTELRLVDVSPLVRGVAADLSHIPTPAKISYFKGETGPALAGAQLVLIPAGVPRKPGMTRDDLFKVNAGIVKGIAEEFAKNCPDAFVGVITNPVNATVPIFTEAVRAAGVEPNPKKIFGVTTLDVLRAETFVSEAVGQTVGSVSVPVIGGHAGKTIIPLFSKATPGVDLDDAKRAALTKRTQEGGTEVVEAKEGAGSATLSMAQAAARFADHVIAALGGKKVTFCAYVGSNPTFADKGVKYFSQQLEVGPNGVEQFVPLGSLHSSESAAVEEALGELKSSIEKGEQFVLGAKN